jgi:hypothetical protein
MKKLIEIKIWNKTIPLRTLSEKSRNLPSNNKKVNNFPRNIPWEDHATSPPTSKK